MYDAGGLRVGGPTIHIGGVAVYIVHARLQGYMYDVNSEKMMLWQP